MFISTRALGLGILFAGVSPASAAAEPKTRLVPCDAGNCLLVTGRRADAAATVTINSHAVSATGARRWRASLPVETVREWSAPYARTITITIGHGRETAAIEADLPIGLLGQAEKLAMLVVSAK